MRGRMAARSVAVLLLAVLLAAGPSSAAAAWLKFVHPKLGFSFSYPSGWVIAPPIHGIEVMVIGPEPAGVSGVRLNVNVTSEALPPGVSVDAYETANESQLQLLFHGYKRLRTDRTKAGGHAALLRYFTWKRNDGVELYQMQLVTVSDAQGYVVTGTTATSSAKLADDAQLLASILASFRPR